MKLQNVIIGVVASCLSNMSFAQEEKMPFGENSHYFLGKAVSRTTNLDNTKGAIFSEDFESFTSSFSTKWEVKRSVDLSGGGLTDATSPMWFLCTPTNFNGNGANYIHSGVRSAAISYNASGFTWLYSKDTISIPDEDGYFLNFWMWYYNNTSIQYITYFHVLIYDVDNATWNSIADWDQTSNSNQFASKVSLSLNDYKGTRVKLAFVYENRDNKGNQMALDDIKVSNSDSIDVSIDALMFNYSEIPVFLADTFKLPFNANVRNNGNTINDTIRISVTSTQLSGFISTAEIADTLDEGESRFVKTDSLLALKFKGQYQFDYKLEIEQGGFNYLSEDTSVFEVSSDIYATDYSIAGGFSLGKDQEFGNIYYVPKTSFIKGIQVGWPNFATPNFIAFDYQLSVYELDPIDSTLAKVLYIENLTKESSQTDSVVTINIDPILCTAGNNYYVSVKQLGSTPLGIGFDRVSNGSFWTVDPNSGDLKKLANPTIGNVSLRLVMKEPDADPQLTFSINDGTNPVADLDIIVVGIDTLKTDAAGQASIKLSNGLYNYEINPTNFAPIKKSVRILNQSITLDITLKKQFEAKFRVMSSGTPVVAAEINISDSLAITNSNGVDSLMLVPDVYSYTVTANGFDSFASELEMVEKDTLIDIELVSGTTCTMNFTITDESGSPVNSSQITLDGYGTKYSDLQGKVSFIGLQSQGTINYSVSKYGFEPETGSVEIVDPSIDVDVVLSLIKYKATFFVSNGIVGLPNALVKVGELNSVSTNANGFAVVSEIAPAADIPYTVSVSNYHSLTGKLTILDSDVRENVFLIAVSADVIDPSTIVVYPNPTTGVFKVSGENIISIDIYDLTGNLVESKTQMSEINEVNLSSKPAGIYFIQIRSNTGVKVSRILKH